MIGKEWIRGTIVDRYCLNKPGSSRETWHIAINIADATLSFRPGDSIGVWPQNPKEVVEELTHYFQLDPSTPILDPSTHLFLPISIFLTECVDLNHLSSQLVELVKTSSSHEDSHRIVIAQEAGETFEGYDVKTFLQSFAPHGVRCADIALGFVRMRPRLYSISSGPSKGTQRIDLTVARVQYEMRGRVRHGLCSHYLIHGSALHESSLRLFHHPSEHFFFPVDKEIPLVMIGAGTGVAPFRAFMQEVEQGVFTPKACWLFFGERRQSTDFFYEEFWTSQVKAGRLRLDLAFSRDQEEKIYVQDRMWHRKDELWHWLTDGAALLVCGNAKKMAKDVDACLADIASSEGGLSSEEALRFLRTLRHQKRYLRDIY